VGRRAEELSIMHSISKVSGVALALLTACSASSSGGDGGSSSGGVASCSMPGKATPGPVDNHCAMAAPDGGVLVNSVTEACDADIPPDADIPSCAYGSTNYNNAADDDDCKYHIVWSSTPICESPGSVTFTFQLTYKDTGKPATGAGPSAEAFTSSPGDWDAATYCDDTSTYLGPLRAMDFVEGMPGTYSGPVQFDRPGVWTVRFHFYEKCTDWPTAPHGHAAFHITVP
jgi:hypothetical protein